MRLSNATLGALPGSVPAPGYDRAALASRHCPSRPRRVPPAHQAAYTNAVLASGDARSQQPEVLRIGTAYGLSPYFRLSIATSLDTLVDGCARIAAAESKAPLRAIMSEDGHR